MTLARKLLHRLGEGPFTSVVRSVGKTALRYTVGWRFSGPLVAELSKLEFDEAGVEADGVPFVRLSDGPLIFGAKPQTDDLIQYRRLPAATRERIPEECIRVARDIICRYVYTQSMPYLTPPYPLAARLGFSLHQEDTIQDIPNLSEAQKNHLCELFWLREGDVVLDVGAYFGIGALRAVREVGPSGLVVSVEADPEAQNMYLRNIQANGVTNAHLVRCEVWKEAGSFTFHVGTAGTRESSLVNGVLSTDTTVETPTDTVDNIVRRKGLTKLSLVSLTINAAEVEAIEGMDETLGRLGPNLSVAGWFRRDGRYVHELVAELLSRHPRYRTAVGARGRLYAWRDS